MKFDTDRSRTVSVQRGLGAGKSSWILLIDTSEGNRRVGAYLNREETIKVRNKLNEILLDENPEVPRVIHPDDIKEGDEIKLTHTEQGVVRKVSSWSGGSKEVWFEGGGTHFLDNPKKNETQTIELISRPTQFEVGEQVKLHAGEGVVLEYLPGSGRYRVWNKLTNAITSRTPGKDVFKL